MINSQFSPTFADSTTAFVPGAEFQPFHKREGTAIVFLSCPTAMAFLSADKSPLYWISQHPFEACLFRLLWVLISPLLSVPPKLLHMAASVFGHFTEVLAFPPKIPSSSCSLCKERVLQSPLLGVRIYFPTMCAAVSFAISVAMGTVLVMLLSPVAPSFPWMLSALAEKALFIFAVPTLLIGISCIHYIYHNMLLTKVVPREAFS